MSTPEQRIDGMGAIPVDGGTAFRVWAPNADAVAVFGDFNDWHNDANPLEDEGNGYWYGFVEGAGAGQEYKYQITNGENSFARVDPYARQVTNSVGNGVIYDHASYDWEGDTANCPPHHELVIYELHVGTFTDKHDGVGNLLDAIDRLDHLVDLGVNAIEIMPVSEFAGDMSWGYNPAHIFAVESAYGGPDGYKTFIKECHKRGLAVIQDVVYNHFGPSDLDLWTFDGWSENDKGGIYFYNDHKSQTPWGDTRPDYGRDEVRQFIRDNAMMWLRDYHVDGLRLDMVPHMYSVSGDYLHDGWTLMRWITDSMREEFPGRIAIAEDLHKNPLITSEEADGAGFHAQWDAAFVHPVREQLIKMDDDHRSITAVADAIAHHYGDPMERVIYTESHDEVANGRARVPQEIEPGNAAGWPSQKRSTIGAALVMTAPGIPMMFQGQEFLEGGWFRDDVPLDWRRRDDFQGIARLYADLIDLRLNRGGVTRGLTGRGLNIYHVNEESNLLVFQRWMDHGRGDDVLVIVNLSAEAQEKVRIGVPSEGLWKLRFNSDARLYSSLFGDFESFDFEPFHEDEDGLDWHANISIGPYSVLIYSQDN
ncbi:MAG TPA: alpha amylase C-terminal domain-containing protein [Tessaracoccus flavescens]|uniref:1,4-alpha-glucan branching enzyme n=1 Tax=Tessaracoccus flavescens TaxID=399497 RepID=A0A921EPV1_9ACTN|nr:alpha amylase C-terminal domain-containing protein [Tessaracoccus flavescens]